LASHDDEVESMRTLARSLPFLALLLAGALAAARLPLDAAPIQGEPIDVATDKQLFLDDLFTAHASGVTLTVNPPRKTLEKNLVADRPWEDMLIGAFTVLDDEGTTKAWYSAWEKKAPNDLSTRLCYATSRDGIHFEKPALGLFEYAGSRETNIVFHEPVDGYHAGTVFKDPSAPPAERYKLVYLGRDGIRGAVSPDGIRWQKLPEPILDYPADTQNNCFWDPDRRSYVMFLRLNLTMSDRYARQYKKRIASPRMIGRAESKSFARFPEYHVVMAPDEADGPDRDLYTNAALKYPFAARAYLIFMSVFDHGARGTQETELATSRDGVRWQRPTRRPFIARGPAGSFESQQIYAGVGVVRTGDGLSMYYGGYAVGHHEPNEAFDRSGVMSRATLRLDGYTSYDAGEAAGTLTTRFLAHRGRRLELNVATAPGGSVRVELLDADLRPVAGHGASAADPIAGDFVARTVTWQGRQDLAGTAGKPLALRFTMKRAKLYAFQFRE
jgi:hypothetical protein